MIDSSPQYFMAFSKYSTRLGHWSDDCSTGHPGSFLNQKEIFLLTGWACGGSSHGLPYSKKSGVC